MFGALGHQLATHFGGAGEAQFANLGGVGDCRGDGAGAAGDNVENPRRNAGAVGKFGQRQCGVRGGAGGFDHHGAACGQGRPGFAGNHGGGEVPGRDRGGDPDGLFNHHDLLAGFGRGNGVAIGPARFFGKPFQERGRVSDFPFGLGQGLALFQRHQAAQVFLVLHHQIVPGHQQVGPFGGGLVAPAGKSLVGGVDGAAGFGFAHAGRGADVFAVCRVVDRKGGAVVSITPLTIDVALLAEQGAVRERNRCHEASPC